MKVGVALAGLFFELGDGFWGVLLQVVVAFASTDFILWILGGLADAVDIIENQGWSKSKR